MPIKVKQRLHIHVRAVARGGLGGLQPPQFLTDQLTLSQPGGTDYAHHSNTSPPRFSDLATGLLTYNDFGPGGSYPPRPPYMCVWHFTVSYFPLGVFMLPTGKGKGLRLFPDF